MLNAGPSMSPPDEEAEIDFDVAEAMTRLAKEGAEHDIVELPLTVGFRMVRKLRDASIIEIIGDAPIGVRFTPQGQRLLNRALKRVAKGQGATL